jgi:hypothetical protein
MPRYYAILRVDATTESFEAANAEEAAERAQEYANMGNLGVADIHAVEVEDIIEEDE